MSTIKEDPGPPKSVQRERTAASGIARLAAGIIILILCFGYLFYSNSQFRKDMRSEITRIDDRIRMLENRSGLMEASLSGQILGLREDIDEIRDSLSK